MGFFDKKKGTQKKPVSPQVKKGAVDSGKILQEEANEPAQKPRKHVDILPIHVKGFDELIAQKGFERGSSILVSGGTGSGKTTFCCQSIYFAALAGEKCIYVSTEENIDKLKTHMLNNYDWDFYKLEEEGKVAFLQLDAIDMAREVEGMMLSEKKSLGMDFSILKMPFKPDRIVFDSLSSLSIAFENTEKYRKYITYLLKYFESNNSVNFLIAETEQDPRIYSRGGIEEFLADGVIVLYNIQSGNLRQNALEILKLRSSKHEKKIVPYKFTKTGLEVFPKIEIYQL